MSTVKPIGLQKSIRIPVESVKYSKEEARSHKDPSLIVSPPVLLISGDAAGLEQGSNAMNDRIQCLAGGRIQKNVSTKSFALIALATSRSFLVRYSDP